MTVYYAVCDAHGPISHRIEAGSVAEAVAVFRSSDTDSWVDGADTDADHDLGLTSGDMTSEAEYEKLLEDAGCEMVCDLEVVSSVHSGRSDHLLGGWRLWQAPIR